MGGVDPKEIEKFEQMAHEWWDPDGRFKPLHRINPLRTDYICARLAGGRDRELTGLRLLDIGCGGGILAESLAELGAEVVGIDRSDKIIGVARAHQQTSGSRVAYRVQSAAELGAAEPASFDGVLAMEVLEHVPHVPGFLKDCAALLKPGGHFFFATLNRTPKAWALAIIGAEYLLRWLPRGTHQYDRFVRPGELTRWAREVGLTVKDVTGMSYSPLRDAWSLGRDASVNYLGYGLRDAGG
ncbi:MAG: bifunctional 2-polyprenyl-6-hydroxyphenol methylase/3-demethylubiquinol 3-O-methyltransferase UbiG [Magnetococcales bacterium]|nr:bifunctional 2-polyprenyl-6-hydroxyphenol methylase/3-demethylubiquinol 3-O-methyltransferase UbiG [Magnetococcales bacterium]